MRFGTFIFFGIMCFLAAGFVWWFVPETKNRTLEEMDEIFGDPAGSAVEDRQRLNKIYLELGLISGEADVSGSDKSPSVERDHFEKIGA